MADPISIKDSDSSLKCDKIIVSKMKLGVSDGYLPDSLLHRPLFTKFNTHPSWAKLVSNHKTYHIPSYYHQREPFFLGRRGSRVGAVLVHNGQMS